MSHTRIPSWNSFTHDTRVEIFLEVIISGGFNILRDAEVIQAALDAKGSRMNLPLPMKTARDLGVKAGFSELFTCRYNYVDQQACKLILEQRFQEPRGIRGSNPIEEAYLENAQRAQEESCNFLEHFIGRLILKLDEKIGTGFLTCCKRNERQSIYGAIFDNYPVYFLKLLRCKEAHVVDFGMM
ncbi:hypothetical protein HYALB_00002106 [Hymenoscyphus albidus]|uniref:Uncharacterized protein n=1 Tax=Hymenoscyphus albidus TaxID=595503 RepID=A0A9N9LMT1_9HELO|nr:hypothetical protein HYALB_00002106 [Hymenoscyphus albidus]